MRNFAGLDGAGLRRGFTLALFVSLLLLQGADLHSSLSARGGQFEANRLINSLSLWLSPRAAVIAVKTAAIVLVGLLALLWRRSRGMDREFALCLLLLVLMYAGVVANNYLTR
jgi:hypothetical protein